MKNVLSSTLVCYILLVSYMRSMESYAVHIYHKFLSYKLDQIAIYILKVWGQIILPLKVSKFRSITLHQVQKNVFLSISVNNCFMCLLVCGQCPSTCENKIFKIFEGVESKTIHVQSFYVLRLFLCAFYFFFLCCMFLFGFCYDQYLFFFG